MLWCESKVLHFLHPKEEGKNPVSMKLLSSVLCDPKKRKYFLCKYVYIKVLRECLYSSREAQCKGGLFI